MTNDILHLPSRTVKPRRTGVTSISDVGLPLGYLKDLLQSYGAYVDIAKLGVGSACSGEKGTGALNLLSKLHYMHLSRMALS